MTEQFETNHSISLSPDLILLEDGPRFLLMDGIAARPLVIDTGKEQVKQFLAVCRQHSTREQILAEFPDPLLFDALLDHGILRSGSEASVKKEPLKSLATSKHEGQQGISLYLLLTQYCNLGCIYCLNGHETYRKQKKLRMTEEVAFAAVEQMLTLLAPGGNLEIVFFGGEPLLNWPLAKKIILYCEDVLRAKYPDKKWHYHLTSNLSLFPADLIEWAKRYGITFLVDIDGREEIHNHCRPGLLARFNSFKKSAANIKRLVAAGIQPALRATITGHNLAQMEDTTLLHRELGGNSSALVPLNPVNSDEMILAESIFPDPKQYSHNLTQIARSGIWDAENLFPINSAIQRVRQRGGMRIACGAPFGNTPVVDVNGDVYVCIYLVGIKRFYAGNILSGTYPRQDLFEALLKELDVDNDPRCRSCAYRYFCGGGCPVGRLTVENNPTASEFARRYAREMQCAVAKTSVNYLLWQAAGQSLDQYQTGHEQSQKSCC